MTIMVTIPISFKVRAQLAIGTFIMDASAAISTGNHHSPLIVVSDFRLKATTANQLGNAYKFHGILMYVAFVAIFPLGIRAISLKPLASFQYHWIVQLSFVGAALLGVYIAIAESWADRGVMSSPPSYRYYRLLA
jgi:hypothetical protein